jgi:hypothetical protein
MAGVWYWIYLGPLPIAAACVGAWRMTPEPTGEEVREAAALFGGPIVFVRR